MSRDFFTPYGLMPLQSVAHEEQVEVPADGSLTLVLCMVPRQEVPRQVVVHIRDLAEDLVFYDDTSTYVFIEPAGVFDRYILRLPEGTLPATACRWTLSIQGLPDRQLVSGRNQR